MRYLKLLLIVIVGLSFTACKESPKFEKDGMLELNGKIKDKFSNDAWYTHINLKGSNDEINTIVLDVTNDPNSLKQEQWALESGFWEKKSNITLRIDAGQPTDYMFQLDKEVSFSKAHDLMQQSLEDLKNNEDISDNLEIRGLTIRSSEEMNSKEDGILYTVTIYNKDSSKSYSYVYYMNGKLKDKHI